MIQQAIRSVTHVGSLQLGKSRSILSAALSTASTTCATTSPRVVPDFMQQPVDFTDGVGKSTPTDTKKRMLSGIQPSGSLHLGNYLGAMKQWVAHQHDYDSYFCVVDLHAITADYHPAELRENTVKAAALYIASGIDPEKSKVFIQSHIPAHTELTWLLGSLTPQGWLQRMTQYKDKAQKKDDILDAPLGLFSYPVLMTADIILYQAELVPVGDDQLQHLELARDIVKRFNHLYSEKTDKNSRVFCPPRALLVDQGSRIMSLQDGRSKMSKSADHDYSRINILDSPDLISSKIKKCKTDCEVGVSFEDEERTECINLLNIYQAVTGKPREEVARETESLKWGTFKPLLTDAIVSHLSPIQQRYREIRQDEIYLNSVLDIGRQHANEVANQTLLKAKDAMGFYIPYK